MSTIKDIVIDNRKSRFVWGASAVGLALLAGVVGWTVGRGSSLDKPQNNYLLSPIRSLVEQKDLIVNVQPLRDQLNEVGKNPNIAVYFEYLNTGANISVNKDDEFWPASLMKIPIAMAVMKKIETGQWRLGNELVLTEGDKDRLYGELYKTKANTRLSVERLLEEMLINSDNTARAIFMRNLKKEDIDEVLLHLGIDDIFNANNQVTAKKYSIFWRSLYTASYLSPEDSEYLIKLMSKSSATQYLAAGLPKNLQFSHKIGVVGDQKIYADSGIVYVTNRPYILTVMVRGFDEEEAKRQFAEISAKAYQYVEKY
ncbi:serine hydrolase [Candidatus Falkowbacteria bacterium]|nr:serine hydrolase [Candidatus Falkowbacteria bacterium]